jgi:hypothetical protein
MTIVPPGTRFIIYEIITPRSTDIMAIERDISAFFEAFSKHDGSNVWNYD